MKAAKRNELPVSQRPGALPEVDLRGIGVHAVSQVECVEYVLDELDAGRGGWVVTPNLDHLLRTARDREFAELYSEARLRVVDGQLLVWALALQRTPVPERVAGSDLISKLSAGAATRKRSVFLLGGNPGTARKAAEVLQARYPGLIVAGTDCPPLGFDKDALAMARLSRRIHQAKPDIVFVALGSPKQELVIRHLRHDRPEAWWLGVGISFSFLCGEVQRAPVWMQRVGLEWLHRVWQEPGRLFKRYFVDGLPFALRLLAQSAVRGVLPMGKTAGPYGTQRPRALLVDDDPQALDHLELLLSSRYPDLELTTRRTPDVAGSFDFYFLDNDFEGELMAGQLAREIRTRNKEALVIAFSGTLDIETLKGLINAGCDGAAEKGVTSSLRPILALVEKRLSEMVDSHKRAAGPFGGVKHAAGSIRDILEDWNERPGETPASQSDEQQRKSA
ncbi:MAG: WecB/TagA/CpsF family glycosyltransferase [Planctomycetes bacterium]|nr:WecB/TagA/CpsF family glycosyltransferase [Planctomycetota bacterium]